MSPKPELYLRFVCRGKMVTGFVLVVCLLPKVVKAKAIEPVWIWVEVRVKRDTTCRCQHQRALY